MKSIFNPKINAKIRPHDTIVKDHNTATNGNKSLTALGPKMWKKLPANKKLLTSITKFKDIMKDYFC